MQKPAPSLAAAVRETRRAVPAVVASGAALAILYYGRAFFITALSAIVIAFILDPFVTLLTRLRLPRSVASLLVCALALLVLYVIGLGAYSQLTALYDDLPKYAQTIASAVDGVQRKIQSVEQRTYSLIAPAPAKPPAAPPTRKGRKTEPAPPPPVAAPAPPAADWKIGDYLFASLGSFYRALLLASFVPFLVYFMLSWRDHINSSFLQLFQGEDRLVAARSLEGIAGMVRAFVVGNALLGALLAILSAAAFWLIHLPYPLLIGPLSGFLSMVPYVGLPLAVAPPLFAALGVNKAAVYVLVLAITALLHLVALNVLYPKLVGSRVHLNPLVVTFSLLLWALLWGAAGLLLAIPVTAATKAVCDNVRELRPIGRLLGD